MSWWPAIRTVRSAHGVRIRPLRGLPCRRHDATRSATAPWRRGTACGHARSRRIVRPPVDDPHRRAAAGRVGESLRRRARHPRAHAPHDGRRGAQLSGTRPSAVSARAPAWRGRAVRSPRAAGWRPSAARRREGRNRRSNRRGRHPEPAIRLRRPSRTSPAGLDHRRRLPGSITMDDGRRRPRIARRSSRLSVAGGRDQSGAAGPAAVVGRRSSAGRAARAASTSSVRRACSPASMPTG